MAKPRILIVHGIHTNDNAAWMDYMVSAFRDAGWDASKWTYGYAYALLTRFQNPGRAKKLAAMVRPGDIVLGHSNGACITWMAAELGAPMGGAILLNPALDTDKVLARQVPWVDLYANRYDEAVPLASLFVGHPWGPQGAEGITIEDARYRTVWTDSEPPMVRGHSAILAPEVITLWTAKIIRSAEARIAALRPAPHKSASGWSLPATTAVRP